MPVWLTPAYSTTCICTCVCVCVCVLCHRWEECKRLLLSPNFFQSLYFFDKDHISRHKLQQLQQMLRSKAWRKVEAVEHGSHAVVFLSTWLSALLDYHQATAMVQPLRDKLATAEKLLAKVSLTQTCVGSFSLHPLVWVTCQTCPAPAPLRPRRPQ